MLFRSDGGLHSEGTIFKISKTGTFQKLHDFCCGEGGFPAYGLVAGRDGNFYATTDVSSFFRITPAGKFTILNALSIYQICNGPCYSSLMQATDGNFYGVTGAFIFRFSQSGQFTDLYVFGTQTGDGVSGTGPMIQASNGMLYGVTSEGGAHGAGTVWQISTKGVYKKIFDLDSTTRLFPNGLLQASDGNLWGTTSNLSLSSPGGAVFAITPAGSFVAATALSCGGGGAGSVALLIQGNGGLLYGDTFDCGNGTVFTVAAGLPLPAPNITTFAPASGAVGAKVTIQGSYFVGATSVTFNGIGAAFQLLSASVISATVPVGATTGTIGVVTAGGSAVSRGKFTVR